MRGNGSIPRGSDPRDEKDAGGQNGAARNKAGALSQRGDERLFSERAVDDGKQQNCEPQREGLQPKGQRGWNTGLDDMLCIRIADLTLMANGENEHGILCLLVTVEGNVA